QTYPVLVMGNSEESDLVYIGRTKFQAPEVDGLTYFGIPEKLPQSGDIINVRITQALEYDLAGEVEL
ncbi:MAG TPA: 30S ribosomal protein S12 methylthiotransferase RimO, partial [Firmicutes bacterium]|nr:30S ribosomal protein S12 methylthiotransferase RimO [Bacillota bacterium]